MRNTRTNVITLLEEMVNCKEQLVSSEILKNDVEYLKELKIESHIIRDIIMLMNDNTLFNDIWDIYFNE